MLAIAVVVVLGLLVVIWLRNHHWHDWGPWSAPYPDAGGMLDHNAHIVTWTHCHQRICRTCGAKDSQPVYAVSTSDPASMEREYGPRTW